MMYIVLTYDVNAKRTAKMVGVCRKYLTHVQRSVFEGEITHRNLAALKQTIGAFIYPNEDTVCIYEIENASELSRESIGVFTTSSMLIVS